VNDLRVLIVADDPLARAGLAALLVGQNGCIVVGQVADDDGLSSAIDVYRPEVVVWDLGWDATSDPSVTVGSLERLTDLSDSHVPIVALVTDETRALEAQLAGARGLLPRDVSGERLSAAVVAAASGLMVLDPPLAARTLGARDPSSLPLVEDLTPRELEVLGLLAEGLPNKAIARRLDISEHTVKFHVNSVLGKLGAQSRTEAVVRATRLGLILL
jgi:two-component system nitrate/nitrite response regulator NarL